MIAATERSAAKPQPRSAAFTPLHAPNTAAPKEHSGRWVLRQVKRRKRRAPVRPASFAGCERSRTLQRKELRGAQPQPNRAERLECVELAPAFCDPSRSTAGASSTHSKRFATKQAPAILAACEQGGRLQRRDVISSLCVLSRQEFAQAARRLRDRSPSEAARFGCHKGLASGSAGKGNSCAAVVTNSSTARDTP